MLYRDSYGYHGIRDHYECIYCGIVTFYMPGRSCRGCGSTEFDHYIVVERGWPLEIISKRFRRKVDISKCVF